MTDISALAALHMVERGLRNDVAPHVLDPHAAAALRAAVTIVGNVRAEIEAARTRDRETLTEALPLTAGWADPAPSVAPEVAEQISRHLERARSSEAEPAEARERLLLAAQLRVSELWGHGHPDRDALRVLRTVTRIDAEARAETAR